MRRYHISITSTEEEIKDVIEAVKVEDLIKIEDNDYSTIIRRMNDVATKYNITIEVVKIMPGTSLFTSVGNNFVVVTKK